MNRLQRSTLVVRILFVIIGLFLIASPANAASANQRDHWGPRYHDAAQLNLEAQPRSRFGIDAVRRWNEITLNANAADHALAKPNQLGPLRTARAFAIVHIAIFDAINAVAGAYRGYTRLQPVAGPISVEAAVAHSAGGVPTLSVVGAFTGMEEAQPALGTRTESDWQTTRFGRFEPFRRILLGRPRKTAIRRRAIHWPWSVPVQGTCGDLPIAAEFFVMRRVVPDGDAAALHRRVVADAIRW
jgi:hypothetical protein